ncbi:hypothetical protein [Dysgonomonas macrotermitis]|uniref:TonB protein C-terminal n=1 Tax=Dysgonomonas macrotermitis TaxID=1346286 RepID=A0A1M4YUQ8_9BACT|nr:hypothetical protein [Dysgonomonas macrotermitis]SHF09076.1 hypothetical protein SAMN05444362_103265 [Dysgonomonas macrotermitis]
MKYFLFIVLGCIFSFSLKTSAQPDSIKDVIYLKYNDSPHRDSLMQALKIKKSRTDYNKGNGYISFLPPVSYLPMYKDGEEEKFRFLFNDPQYSATEKKKVAAIILQGNAIEQELVDDIRYITLNPTFMPSVSSEHIPVFPGGYQSMISYLNEHIRISSLETNKEDLDKHAYLVLCFIVEKDGYLNNIKIIDSCNLHLDYEAYRLIKHMPKWITGPQHHTSPAFVVMQLIFNKEL